MAGEVQTMSRLDDSSEFLNAPRMNDAPETEEKDANHNDKAGPLSEVSEVGSSEEEQQEEQLLKSESRDQSLDATDNDVPNNNEQEQADDDERNHLPTEEMMTTEPLPPSLLSTPPTVTSMDSLDLLRTKADSNSEIIDAVNLSETEVASEPIAEAVVVDQKSEEEGNDQGEESSRPSFASRAGAAAATAATGISAALSSLSSSTSPKSSPRASRAASPTRSTKGYAEGNDQVVAADMEDKPSLVARAAAAAAAAATGIMPILSNLSPRNSPRNSPNRSSPFSTARTWPDENNTSADMDDIFFDNGEAIPGSLPSPPRKPQQQQGSGQLSGPFDMDDCNSPAPSPVAAAAADRSIPNITSVDIEAGQTENGDNATEDDEARVLSVVPTMVEDNYEPKTIDLDAEVNREVPGRDSAHGWKETTTTTPTNHRVDALKAGLKTKKGMIILVTALVVVIAMGVGIGLALSPSEPSYCNAVRGGYPIPNENQYKQLDLNWFVDVSTTEQWDPSFLTDVKTGFQSILIPTMAGCKGSFVEEKDARIVNGYTLSVRDMGDCSSLNLPRPCLSVLIDFSIWIKGYLDSREMIRYLTSSFATNLKAQIESKLIVQTAEPVLLEEV